MKHCARCNTDKNELQFYKNDRYCIQCRKKWSLEYYHRKLKGVPAQRKWNKLSKSDLDNAEAWNKEHPYVFSDCQAFVEHAIFTGRAGI